MKPIPSHLIDQFAAAFCFGRVGFAKEEIPGYFASYQEGVPTLHSLEASDKRGVFVSCVLALTPRNQRLALYDLCDGPPPSKHRMPGKDSRLELLHALVQADGRSPLGRDLSALTIRGIREQWMTAASRIRETPPAAITAARSLVETTCKTILADRVVVDSSGGDLGKLYKLTREALGINPSQGDTQNVHQITNGLVQVIDGLAGLSNKAGDRHGLEAGAKIDDTSYASLAVHAAGTIALFMAQTHRVTGRGPTA